MIHLCVFAPLRETILVLPIIENAMMPLEDTP